LIEDMPKESHSIAASQDETVYGRQVMQANERLPPDYRSVILLVSVEDLSYADAAKVLSIPIGTVMSRLSGGREQLRALLEPQLVSAGMERPHLRSVK
jgi:RNA polymerase sigma-70 factor (ECF subfamily)